MKNFKLTPVKENLKLENKNSESDLNFKNPVSNFMNCMTRLVQVSINYGINSKSINNYNRVQSKFYSSNDTFGENLIPTSQ